MTAALLEAHRAIRKYSTTWYVPVTTMPAGLNEALSSAYLLMRAIDEIEDHPELLPKEKDVLLCGISSVLQERCRPEDFKAVLADTSVPLPEVSLRIGEWAALAPPQIAPRIRETFATMAERMGGWALHGWHIHTERDLDRYTYAVAGTLVLLLSDLWSWYDGTRSDRTLGVGYGRALQAVNIYQDKGEDLGRGVDFWPDGWDAARLRGYAMRELHRADRYLAQLPAHGPAYRFCSRPLAAAWRTIRAGPGP
ncbi:squalene/phytoene synthase family protein [Streptomyces sp. JH002]|uniref:squalene/phytoene synthase family protein n=1 Tax=Streptomyces TaxID=1883 RepID=UPI0036797527